MTSEPITRALIPFLMLLLNIGSNNTKNKEQFGHTLEPVLIHLAPPHIQTNFAQQLFTNFILFIGNSRNDGVKPAITYIHIITAKQRASHISRSHSGRIDVVLFAVHSITTYSFNCFAALKSISSTHK